MSEWITKPLGKLVSFQKGRKVETSEYPLQGFAPYLGASAISGVIEEYGDTQNGVMAALSDVLMLWDGERSGLVGKAQAGVISSTVARLSPKDEVESLFLYYALNSKFEWIQGRRTGTGVPHVPKDLGRILQISYPKDKNQQCLVTEILSTIDETIEQTEALIVKYQQIKAGMMHDLFTRGVTPDGKLRPSRDQAPDLYKESHLGWIPKDWGVKPLSSYTKSDITYGIVQAGPHIDGGVPYIRTGDMFEDYIERDTLLCTSRRIADAYKRSEMLEGDIVCAIRATVGKVLQIPPELDGANLTQGTARIAPNSETDSKFLLWSLRSESVQYSIKRYIKGTTFSEITLQDLRNLPVASPNDISEQRNIGIRLEACERRIQCEKVLLNKIKMKKKGLMQDLLTGRVRVNIPKQEEV